MFTVPTTTLYALIGMIAVTIGSLGYAAYEHQRAERYQVEKQAADDEVTRLLASVGSKDTVINDLSTKLKEWQDHSATQTAAANEAAARLAAAEQALRDKQRDIRRLEEQDRVNPTCQAFLKTDIAQYCPGLVGGMRLRAGNGLQRPTDTRTNTGTGEAR